MYRETGPRSNLKSCILILKVCGPQSDHTVPKHTVQFPALGSLRLSIDQMAETMQTSTRTPEQNKTLSDVQVAK
jgi:hypothetical protein